MVTATTKIIYCSSMKDSQRPVSWEDKESYRILLSHWHWLAKHMLRYHLRQTHTTPIKSGAHSSLACSHFYIFKDCSKSLSAFFWITNKEKEDASQKVLFQKSTLMTLPQIDANTRWFIHSCGGSSSVSSYLPYGRKNTLKNQSNSSSTKLHSIQVFS